jgi:hypothetical protein
MLVIDDDSDVGGPALGCIRHPAEERATNPDKDDVTDGGPAGDDRAESLFIKTGPGGQSEGAENQRAGQKRVISKQHEDN